MPYWFTWPCAACAKSGAAAPAGHAVIAARAVRADHALRIVPVQHVKQMMRIKQVKRTELAERMIAVAIRTVKAQTQMLSPKMSRHSGTAVRPALRLNLPLQNAGKV